MASASEARAVRLDKWLFVTRIYRNRELAHRACEMGRVTVNGQPAKPHRNLQIGDRIEAQVQPDWTRVVIVKELVDRPVPKAKVLTLFEDLSPPRPAPDPWKKLLARPPVVREKGAGRPTKRERRALAALRRERPPRAAVEFLRQPGPEVPLQSASGSPCETRTTWQPVRGCPS